jgi:hypothetical protein
MDQVPLLNLGNQCLPSGTEFESAIYQGEQRQLSPDTYPQDRVRTCPDLGELVANPFLPLLHREPARVMYLLDIPRGRSTPMALLRFSPRSRLAFCTGYRPPIPLRGRREQRGGGRRWASGERSGLTTW